MSESERYSRVSDIVRLALRLQQSDQGMSLADIQEYFSISRRTAERMRDTILNIYGDVSYEVRQGVKYWKLKANSASMVPSVQNAELTALENSIELLKKNKAAKKDLDSLITLKNKAFCLTKAESSISADYTTQFLVDGLAVNIMPMFKISDELLMALKQAIIAENKVTFLYNNSNEKVIVHPYGFLYGVTPVLVAWSEQQKDFVSYALTKIAGFKVSKTTFKKREFLLSEYAAKYCSSALDKKIFEISLKFTKKVANEALQYVFHPSQENILQKDGSLIVNFIASGLLELVWMLFRWGNQVKILAPKELQKLYKEKVSEISKNL